MKKVQRSLRVGAQADGLAQHVDHVLQLVGGGDEVPGQDHLLQVAGGDASYGLGHDGHPLLAVAGAVGEDEADLKLGLINVSSPIARALIGKDEGDVAEFQAPGGVKRYEIVSVNYL